MRTRATLVPLTCIASTVILALLLDAQEPGGGGQQPTPPTTPTAGYRAWLNLPDGDGDGVPDSDEGALGLGAETFDSDADGIDDGDPFAGIAVPAGRARVEVEFIDLPEVPEGQAGEALRWKPLHRVARSGLFHNMAKAPAAGHSGRLESVGLAGDHRIYRMRGWLTAPQDAAYTFWLSADDDGELWLSDDASPFKRKRAAECHRWVRRYQWGNFGSQQSDPVGLQAGQRYYFEVRWTQQIKDTHAAVAWAVDGGRPAVIGRRHIEAYSPVPEDADDNGLPDAWEAARGLGGGDPDGDSDGDGLTDLQEFQLGADPAAADSRGRGGVATWELWEGFVGRYVFDITSTGRVFPSKPTRVGYLDRLETPPFLGENYATRLRGGLKIPQDGYYTFWIASDDHSELWLSRDSSSMGRRRVARVVGHTGWRDFFVLPEQRSTPIFLRGGRACYFEVLHKESRGVDHLSVAWSRSDTFGAEGVPQPAVIGGEHLVSWQPDPEDADDDGLPDAWELATGLPAAATAHLDSDGDGVSNWREYLSGRDPLQPDNANPSLSLLCETWYEVPGARATAFCGRAPFPASPDEVTYLSELKYDGRGEDYACRLRGYLAPPADGEYHFSVSGDDEVELWLSPSGNKFSKRKVASVNSKVGWRKWGKSSAQDSGAISLRAGQDCYIEVVHKQGTGGGHVAVAWQIPGRKQSTIILSEYLRPYKPVAGDADDDDLPDSWETANGLSAQVPGGEHGAWGDPDGDLLDNLREFQLGTDPLVADAAGRSGLALWESWEDLGREHVADLLYSKKFPGSPDNRAWLEQLKSPPDRGDNYGSRMRAILVAPETGTYTFWVTGNNEVHLLLSADPTKFNKRLIAEVPEHAGEAEWEKYGLQRSAPIRLAAGGQYFIEVLQKEGLYADHVAVSWTTPGAAGREIIGGEHLIAFERDPDDLDDDDLPDSWEIANGLDPLSAQGGEGAPGDLDGDGLSNRGEFLAGTAANNADSDGDGLSDADELGGLGTDPLVANAGMLALESTISGGAFSGGQGFESIAGEVAVLSDRQGQLRYPFETAAPGARVVRVSPTVFGGTTQGVRIPAVLSIDGVEVADGAITAWGGGASRFSVLTQNLTAGAHELVLELFVDDSTAAVQIGLVEVLEPTGADADGNGVADWIDGRRAAENTIITGAGTSQVSPACIEGTARFPGLVSVAGLAAEAGVRGHWFADIPLSPDGAATAIGTAMDNGALARSVQVSWAATDVTAGGTIDLRQGDSLRLSAAAAGTITIVTPDGGDPLALSVPTGTAQPFQFDQPGVYRLLAGTVAGPPGAQLTVHAHRGDFGGPLFVYRDLARHWETPGVSGRLAIEPDPRLEFTELDQPGAVARVFRVLSREPGQRHVLARLPAPAGGGRGAVVARGTVGSYRLVADSARDHRVMIAGTLGDGSSIVRIQLMAEALPPGGYIEIRVHVAGVTFLDGTTTRRLYAGDFAADGSAAVDLIRPPGTDTSVCHSIHAFDAAGNPVGH